MEKLVSMAELKNKATQIIREVETKGLEVYVTKHSIPVVVIRQITNEEKKALAESSGLDIVNQAKPLARKIAKFSEKEADAIKWINEERR